MKIIIQPSNYDRNMKASFHYDDHVYVYAHVESLYMKNVGNSLMRSDWPFDMDPILPVHQCGHAYNIIELLYYFTNV